MEKKRKRASFSPTVSFHSDLKKSEVKPAPSKIEEEENPVLQQVVEVVIEEPHRQDHTVKKEQEYIEYPKEQIDPEETVRVKPTHTAIDQEEMRRQLKEELREELLREMRAERSAKVEPQEEVVEEVYAEPEPEEEPEVTHGSQPETAEEEIIEEVSAGPEELEENQSEEEDDETRENKQKETVAELFGKNSEAIMPEITVHKNSNTRGLLIWAVTMVAIAVGVGGGLVVFTNRSNQTPNPAVSNPGGAVVTPENSPAAAAPSKSVSPSPTVKPTSQPIAKKPLKVQVQNGGGVVGAGSKMKAYLESKGYTVSDVGNASTYGYEETEIDVKESKSDIRDTIEEDLSNSYTIGKVETSLPESSPYDIRVIVGKK